MRTQQYMHDALDNRAEHASDLAAMADDVFTRALAASNQVDTFMRLHHAYQYIINQSPINLPALAILVRAQSDVLNETNVSHTETSVAAAHDALINNDGWESDAERARRQR